MTARRQHALTWTPAPIEFVLAIIWKISNRVWERHLRMQQVRRYTW